MKITLIGKALTISDQTTHTVITMESAKVPALPKGVPAPPTSSTKYTAYIGSKQWKKVAEAAKDEEDTLIIEGYPTLADDHIAVFATNASSKKLMQAAREKQQEQATTT